MKFTDGMQNAILADDLPVLSLYDLYIMGARLFTEKTWQGEALTRPPREWDMHRTRNAIQRMVDRQVLVADADFRSGVWRVTQSTRAGTAEEVACIADPFCYVSHLSAMQRYGLTDRSPVALHLSTPRRDIWNKMRISQVRHDLPDTQLPEKPILGRPGFRETLRRRDIIFHLTVHPWSPAQVAGEETRMTSIGQTFADMLIEPALCGGMRHVLEVWEREADPWLAEIVEVLDQSDSQIAKVRAGYILSEVLDIRDPVVDGWERFAQRGGSRKLDPEASYAPEFSERWMISINV